MSKQTMTIIDTEKLRTFVEEKGAENVTRMLGKARYYFKNIYSRGQMPTNVLNALCRIYGLAISDFTPDVPEQTPEFTQFEISPVEVKEDAGIEFETELRRRTDVSAALIVTMRCGDRTYTGKSVVFFDDDDETPLPSSMACGMIDALEVINMLIEQDEIE